MSNTFKKYLQKVQGVDLFDAIASKQCATCVHAGKVVAIAMEENDDLISKARKNPNSVLDAVSINCAENAVYFKESWPIVPMSDSPFAGTFMLEALQ